VYRRVKSPKNTHLRFETHAAALEKQPESVNNV
jgi:hypothetical protein